MVSLIGHLHQSSLGHLSLRSVDNSTFAWIDGLIKLKDISNIVTDDTACSGHSDCLIEGSNTGMNSKVRMSEEELLLFTLPEPKVFTLLQTSTKHLLKTFTLCFIIVVIITCFSKCAFVWMLEHDIRSIHT